MEAKQGAPAASVEIYTDDMKLKFYSELGDYNSEILSITTNKDMGSPAGTFNITFVPNLDKERKTWFDKLDAYDYVQISFKGINDPDFAVVMRGLIDTVNKTESWEGGTPQRRITISGRDLGCLLTDHQIYYVPELGQREALEGMLTYLAWKNFVPGPVNADEAFNVIGDRLYDGMNLSLGGGSIKQVFGFMAEQMYPNDKTNLWHLKGYEGPYWNAFAQYQDKPFHEIFVHDSPKLSGASWLILRPSKLKDARGNFHKAAKDNFSSILIYPPDWEFTDKDLVSINVSKNYNEVFNYYITIPALQLLSKMSFRGLMVDASKGNLSGMENPFIQTNPMYPAFIGKFGFKKYEATTYFVNLDFGQEETRNEDYEKRVVVPRFMQTGIERNRTLVAWFLHNEHLLSGNIDIAGTNKAVIGTYAKSLDDRMEYYVEGVNHSFVLFANFRTSLRVTRGMPSSEIGGLCSLYEADERMNRYYFEGEGTKDVYGPVTMPVKESDSEARYVEQYQRQQKIKSMKQKTGPSKGQQKKTTDIGIPVSKNKLPIY